MKKFALLIAVAACSGAAFATGASASKYSNSITETVSTVPASDVAASAVSDVTASAASDAAASASSVQ